MTPYFGVRSAINSIRTASAAAISSPWIWPLTAAAALILTHIRGPEFGHYYGIAGCPEA